MASWSTPVSWCRKNSRLPTLKNAVCECGRYLDRDDGPFNVSDRAVDLREGDGELACGGERD